MFLLLLLAEAADLIDADSIDAADTTNIGKSIDKAFTSIRSPLATLPTTSTHHSTPSTPHKNVSNIIKLDINSNYISKSVN